MVMTFLTILAWVGFVGGTIVTGFRIWGMVSTTDFERALARAKGYTITHPIKTSGTIMIICGAFLLARALS